MADRNPETSKRQPILADHVRVGKRLVPPFIAKLGKLHETSWVKRTLPEVLWIAVLQSTLGRERGDSVVHEVAGAAHSLREKSPGWFGLTSPYAAFVGPELGGLRDHIRSTGHWPDFQRSIAPLVTLYPDCPLRLLCDDVVPIEEAQQFVPPLRELVSSMLDKGSVESIQALRVVFEVAGRCGLLRVMKGSGFENFGDLVDYPSSEGSQKVAALLRACAGMLEQASVRGEGFVWPDHFWNQSLVIDPCTFDA